MAKVSSYTITSEQLNQVRNNNPKIKLPTQGTYIPIPGRKFQNLETGEIFTRRVLDNARFGRSQEQRYKPFNYVSSRYFENSKTYHYQYLLNIKRFYEATLKVLSIHPSADSFYYIIEYRDNNGKIAYAQSETLLRRNANSIAILNEIILSLINKYTSTIIENLVIGVIER